METYTVHLSSQGHLIRLPVIPVPGTEVSIAALDVTGDMKTMRKLARLLADRLESFDLIEGSEVIVVPEAKAVPLAHELALQLGLEYVALRKRRKLWAGNAFFETVHSITTDEEQRLWLYEQDVKRVVSRDVLLFDDIVSSGATLRAMHGLLNLLVRSFVAAACVFVEGAQSGGIHVQMLESEFGFPIVSLGHLPLFDNVGG